MGTAGAFRFKEFANALRCLRRAIGLQFDNEPVGGNPPDSVMSCLILINSQRAQRSDEFSSRWTRIYRLIAQLPASVHTAYTGTTFTAENWICRAPCACVLLTS